MLYRKIVIKNYKNIKSSVIEFNEKTNTYPKKIGKIMASMLGHGYLERMNDKTEIELYVEKNSGDVYKIYLNKDKCYYFKNGIELSLQEAETNPCLNLKMEISPIFEGGFDEFVSAVPKQLIISHLYSECFLDFVKEREYLISKEKNLYFKLDLGKKIFIPYKRTEDVCEFPCLSTSDYHLFTALCYLLMCEFFDKYFEDENIENPKAPLILFDFNKYLDEDKSRYTELYKRIEKLKRQVFYFE